MTDMEGFEALLGEWTTEVRHPDIGVVHGEMSVEWLDGGGYLIQRSSVEDTRFPRGARPDRPDGGGRQDRPALLRLARRRAGLRDLAGERRLADVARRPGVLAAHTGRFTDDGSAIEGVLERTEPDGTWVHDFDLTYRRKR